MVVGGGGCGVSTTAAAAVLDSSAGQSSILGMGPRTLLVSVDRFRSASRTLGVVSRPGQPIPVAAGVDLLELDTATLVSEAWADTRELLPSGFALAQLAPDELAGIPGIDDLLILRRIRDEATSGRYRRVVVDTSGGSDAFTLLAIPTMLRGYLNRVWPRHRRMAVAATSPRLARIVAFVDSLDADCADIAELLIDGELVTGHLVMRGDQSGRELGRRHLAALHLLGVAVTSIHVRTTSDDVVAEVAACDEARSAAVSAMPDLGSQPLIGHLRAAEVVLPESDGSPVGVAAATVRRVGEALFEFHCPLDVLDDDVFTLGRVGDDIVVTITGLRHRITLPSVLRRCTVAGADLSHGMLVVTCIPDEKVWPK